MLANRSSAWTIVFAVAVLIAVSILAVTAYPLGRNGQVPVSGGVRSALAGGPDAYFPLPPGKQTALANAARTACLEQVQGELKIARASKPAAYYPVPAGKQTALVNAAIRACIDGQIGRAGTGKPSD